MKKIGFLISLISLLWLLVIHPKTFEPIPWLGTFANSWPIIVGALSAIVGIAMIRGGKCSDKKSKGGRYDV